MFSIFHEWVAYLYGFFQFIGFGRSPLWNVQDKYTEQESVTTSNVPTLNNRIVDLQNEVDRVEYYMV